MSRDVIRQVIVGGILVALVLIALLVITSLALSWIYGAHHAGIQLIAPFYQHQHILAHEV